MSNSHRMTTRGKVLAKMTAAMAAETDMLPIIIVGASLAYPGQLSVIGPRDAMEQFSEFQKHQFRRQWHCLVHVLLGEGPCEEEESG